MKTKCLTFFLVATFFLSTFVGAEEEPLVLPTKSSVIKKVYVHPSQIHFLSEGIFFLDANDDLQPGIFVGSDGQGLYVAYYQCPACQKMNSTGICDNKKCPLYGK